MKPEHHLEVCLEVGLFGKGDCYISNLTASADVRAAAGREGVLVDNKSLGTWPAGKA